MPILVFLRLSVLDLGPMYAIDRQPHVRLRRLVIFYLKCAAYKFTYLLTYVRCQTDVRRASSRVRGIKTFIFARYTSLIQRI